MPSRESRRDRADRLTAGALASVGDGLKEGRVGSGLSLAVVADACGLSGSEVSRLERGLIRHASLLTLNRIAHATGQSLSVKLYPAEDAVRDVAHQRLLDRFRERLHLSFRWRTEVPLFGSTGLQAWDALADADRESTAIEAETRIRDGQALSRRLQLKLEADPSVSQLILLVADTRANRAALAVIRESMRGTFPLDTRQVLAAFSEGRHPSANGLVVL